MSLKNIIGIPALAITAIVGADSAYASNDKIRLGLEASLGTNNEIVPGIFVNVPLIENIGFDIHGNYYANAKKLISSNSETKVTERERELIGPGTYKQRTDEIITTTTEKPIAEIGIRPKLKIGKFEVNVGYGAVLFDQEEELYGRSTIIHERNQELLREPQIIENSKSGERRYRFSPSLSAGANFNLNKNLAIGISGHDIGTKKSARVNLRYRF